MILETLGLLSLGFLVGLSGAAIPGPLLAFTVYDSTKKNKITGHLVIFGHVAWEFVVILIILFGFGWIILRGQVLIYGLGGPVLILMGLGMLRSRLSKVELTRSRTDSSILGGIFYTAFNPTQPLWWTTAGLALLLKGLEIMGLLGVVFVTIGHWLSDLVYYTFISAITHRQRDSILPHQQGISRLLGMFLIALGIYFFTDALARVLT